MKTLSAAATPANKTEHEGRHSWRSWRQPVSFPPRFKNVTGHDELRGNETVLVTAEASPLRDVVSTLLRQLGYRVFHAGDAVEAQRQAHVQRRIHLLLMELTAPEMRDVELVHWFRAVYPDTRVLIAAGSLWELNLQLGNAEDVCLLAKPFTPLELARMVRRVLD